MVLSAAPRQLQMSSQSQIMVNSLKFSSLQTLLQTGEAENSDDDDIYLTCSSISWHSLEQTAVRSGRSGRSTVKKYDGWCQTESCAAVSCTESCVIVFKERAEYKWGSSCTAALMPEVSLLELIATTVHAPIQFVRHIPVSIQAALLS